MKLKKSNNLKEFIFVGLSRRGHLFKFLQKETMKKTFEVTWTTKKDTTNARSETMSCLGTRSKPFLAKAHLLKWPSA